MRKLAKILISLLVLIIGGLLVAPFLIPLDTYKKEATNRLTLMLGREIRIEGPMRLKLFPDVAVSLNKVSIGNPAGFSKQPFATVEQFDVSVPLNALLDKQIIITSLVLNKPVVHMEVNKAGRNNWQFEIQTPKTVELSSAFEIISSANAAPQKSFGLQSLALKHIEINDGVVAMVNQQTGTTQAISGLAMVAKADSVSKPLDVSGAMVWNGEKLNIESHGASIQSLISGVPTQLTLSVEGDPIKLSFAGTASPSGAKGKLEVGSHSLVHTAKWLGNSVAWNKTPLKFALRGDVTAIPTGMKLDNADMVVDDLRLRGAVNVSIAGAKPMVVADLSTDTLNLNPYMVAANLPSNWLISEAYAVAPWTQAPLDFKGLRAFDADIKLKANAIKAKVWDLKNVNLRANVQSGQLALNIANVETFGGAMTGVIRLNGAGDRAGLGLNVKGSGVQVQPLLKAVAGNDRITGTGEFTLDVDASGNSQADMVRNLNGKGTLMVRNGMIKGVNLAQMARNIRGAFTGQVTGAAKDTDFSELGGSYTITSGIISNQDLGMKAPYMRLSGKGDVNLPAYTIHYRLVPEVVDTGKGQGGADKSGIAVPILIAGSLDNPSFTPDVNSMVQDALKDPQKLKANIAAVKEALKENKGDIKQQIKDTQQLLKSGNLDELLGGFKQKPAPAPVPVPEVVPAPAPVPAQ